MKYKILATHNSRTPEGWQCFVAIASREGCFKAYSSPATDYPTFEDVLATAERGQKMQPADAAVTFSEVNRLNNYEY